MKCRYCSKKLKPKTANEDRMKKRTGSYFAYELLKQKSEKKEK